MRPRGAAAVLALSGALVATTAGQATAAAPVVVREPLALTQPEVVCGGEEVPVTYDGELVSAALTTGNGQVGTSVRFRADLSWTQQGTVFRARVSGGYTVQPGGRTSSYRVVGSGVADDGTRVRLLEVVHATLSTDGDPELRVEFERVDCW